MKYFRKSLLVFWTAVLSSTVMASGESELFKLAGEPLIRIGLSTNSGSVTITTADSSLVSVSPDEQSKFLATNRVTVSARAYRAPEIENYRIEFQNLPTQNEATTLAREIRDATGETAFASIDTPTNTWKVWVGSIKDSIIDADELKAKLAENGFDDAVTITEKKTAVSSDAIALSQQIKTQGASEVRSLIKTTGSANPMVTGSVDPNLREELLGEPFGLNARMGHYTTATNLLDMAAIALPAGYRANGTGFGISFIGPASADSMLFDLGETYMAASSDVKPMLDLGSP